MGQPPDRHLALLLLLLLWGQRSNPEVRRPSCDRCDRRLACNCSCGGWTCVPTVTDRALTLDLSFNYITTVTGDDLTGHGALGSLSLHGNVDWGIVMVW